MSLAGGKGLAFQCFPLDWEGYARELRFSDTPEGLPIQLSSTSVLIILVSDKQ